MAMEVMGGGPIQALAGGMGAGVQPMFDLAGGHRDYDGGFGGNGIWAILLLALLGRRGFGDDGCAGNGCALPVITNDNINTKFQALQDTINWNGAAAVSATQHASLIEGQRDLDAALCKIDSDVQRGFGDTNLELCKGFGITNNNINQGFAHTDLELCKGFGESRLQAAVNAQALSRQLDECCCTLRMEGTANTQKILDKLCASEIQELRDKLSCVNLEKSQLMQNATLINALRPFPIPAFRSCNPLDNNFGFGCGVGSPCNTF